MSIKLSKKVFYAAIIGNILEWYEFALFGYFATTFSKLFFPSESAYKSIIITYIVFAMGLLMRPIGAIIFGYIGDRFGSRKALLYSVSLMTIPTFIIGILPTYQDIGIAASISMVCCRFFQGIAVGGEFSSSMVYITDNSQDRRRGFFGSIVMQSAFIGLFMGSIFGAITNYFAEIYDAETWAWRIPFLSGVVLLIVALFLRKNMPIIEVDKKKVIVSIRNYLFSFSYIKKILQMIMLVSLPSMAFYLIFVYFANFAQQHLNISSFEALSSNSIGIICLIIAIPFFGHLSDSIGKGKLYIIGLFCFIIFSCPLFYLLTYSNFYSIAILQCVFAVLIAIVYAPVPAILYSNADEEIRCFTVSMTYNVANSIFGASAPAIAEFLIHNYTSYMLLAWYLIILSLLGLVFGLNLLFKKKYLDI
ncbi:MFS transporter [Candidatus Bandiella numerosa]|uniref:MFS transporter n=1 Tax=Candidatus Bandiella numerosa TaxID=2570586 RepID=UPI00249DE3A8|nr:MFS transporter [Candidatus Bandiella numerosa]WHA04426.1 MFS transporter [Candidatus Bandiella numerosa]